MAGLRPSSRKPRVDRVRAALQRLAEAQEAIQWELHELTEAQRRTDARLEHLAQAQQRTETRLEELGNIDGRPLEDRYADPFSFVQAILTRMRAVPKHELDTLASDSVDRGYLLAEVSATIAPRDVARAIRRAAPRSRLTGESAPPAVAGAAIDPDAAAVGQDVWRVPWFAARGEPARSPVNAPAR